MNFRNGQHVKFHFSDTQKKGGMEDLAKKAGAFETPDGYFLGTHLTAGFASVQMVSTTKDGPKVSHGGEWQDARINLVNEFGDNVEVLITGPDGRTKDKRNLAIHPNSVDDLCALDDVAHLPPKYIGAHLDGWKPKEQLEREATQDSKPKE